MLWRPTQDPIDAPAYVLDALDLARAAGLTPGLMGTNAGDRALVLPCRAALSALGVRDPATAQDNTGENVRPECGGGLLAILALAHHSDPRRAIESLVEAAASQGHRLELIGLPTSGLAAIQPDTLGLRALADTALDRPEVQIRLYLPPPSNAPLRDNLSAGPPPLAGEAPGNLARRRDWFQRRSGARD